MKRLQKDVRVIVLAGGMGTRLRSVISDRPKILAPIGEGVLLDRIMENLLGQGFRNITLSVGYMKEKVREYIKRQSFSPDAEINFSEEENPLGTGGAIKKAFEDIPEKTILVLNGDTFFPIDYWRFIGSHKECNADVSIGLKEVPNSGRYGRVVLNEEGRIISFKEKGSDICSGIINGGVYVFKKEVFDNLNLPEIFSIEVDFFEKHLERIKIYGFVFSDHFIDIGVPNDYKEAREYFSEGR